MAYEDAKRELTDARAVVISIDQKEFSDTIVARRVWENVPEEQAQEYIEYLDALSRTVVDPTGCPPGTYRILRNAYVNDEGSRAIHQFLAKNLNTDSDFSTGDTGWRLATGATHRGSNNRVTLELPYCDPQYAEAIVNSLSEKTCTNEIHTLNGAPLNDGLLQGTWHNIQASYEIDDSEGWATVRWFLSKQANDDLHFGYQKNEAVFAVDFYKFDAADTGLSSFETDYYFDALGNWYISDGTNYTEKNGATAAGLLSGEPGYGTSLGTVRTVIVGRTARAQITRDPTSRFYMLHTHIEFLPDRDYSLTIQSAFGTTTKEIVEYSAGADTAAFVTAHSLDAVVVGQTIQVTAPWDAERGMYRLTARVTQSSELTTGNSISYGTPNVTVTETIVEGASALPANAGTPSYNDWGTIETSTNALEKRYNAERGTWSYILQSIEKRAPHITGTEEPGYVEGPSELKLEIEKLALAKGVGSGYASLGSWTGGGRGRIRHVSPSDGIGVVVGSGVDVKLAQATKKFQPYNVTLARKRTVRTSSRLYYYVKEPVYSATPADNQYPAWADGLVEDMDADDLGNSTAPYLVSTTVLDDTAETYGTQYSGDSGYYLDGSDYPGKFVRYTYSDGAFTIAYFKANVDLGSVSNDYESNINWRELQFVRTYPAEGAIELTAITNPGGGKITLALAAHGLTTGDAVVIHGTTSYDGYYTIDSVATNTITVTATYVANEAGTVARIDAVNLKADPTGALSDDDGLYMGHYIIEIPDSAFFVDSTSHRIMKISESIYALVIQQVEKTPWEIDHRNKWVLNSEGLDMTYGSPPSFPSLADGTGDSNVPFIM